MQNYSKLFAASIIAFAISLNAHGADPQQIDTAILTDTRVEMIEVTKPGNPGKSFTAGTIINAPMQRLCAILLDFPAYPGFMPNTDKASVVQTSEEFSVVEMTLKLPLGKIKKYRLKMEPKLAKQQCWISWKLVPWEGLRPEETIVDTTGYWLLIPDSANANRTVVKYFVNTDPGAVPLGLGWIVDSMSKDSIPKTLDALRAKALTR